jgi:hypothetical protein
MLLLISFVFFGLVITATGFLMFAFPATYVKLLNTYYSKRGLRKRALILRYSRWSSRLSGFLLFLSSFLIYYEFWIQLRNLTH